MSFFGTTPGLLRKTAGFDSGKITGAGFHEFHQVFLVLILQVQFLDLVAKVLYTENVGKNPVNDWREYGDRKQMPGVGRI